LVFIEDSDQISGSARRLLAPSFLRNINYDLLVGYLIHVLCFDLASDFKLLVEPWQGLPRCLEFAPEFVG
jgi:hypothetical protein